MKFAKFSEQELIDLLWAWAALTFAFAIALTVRGIGLEFIQSLVVTGIAVGTAFLFHEMAHKILAQKYGCWAEFRKFNFTLILAVVMSFSGWILAAPGAVMIDGFVSKEQSGKMAAAGPAVNIVLAGLFFLVGTYLLPALGVTSLLFNYIIFFGFLVNAWLALFNMLPFSPFDGSKVMSWSFPVWLGIAVIAGFMVFFLGF